MKGSLTLEAAYIVPFCIFIVGVVCYLGVFEYNRAVLKMTGYECILRTMEERTADDTIFWENLLNRANEEAGLRTFGITELDVKAKITVSQIVLHFQGIQTFFRTPIEVMVAYERTCPELMLRTMTGR